MDTSLQLPFNGVQDVEKSYSGCFESQRDHQREHVGHHKVTEYDDDLEQGHSRSGPVIHGKYTKIFNRLTK